MAQAPANGDQPKKKSKLLLIIIVAVVLLGGGGGAAWFFMRPGAGDQAAKPQPAKPSVFLPLEMFTGNLMPQDGQPQYIQLGLTLKLADQPTADLIKDRTPEVRNRILMVLSGKKGADLLPVAGKQKLAAEIEMAIREVVPGLAAKAAPAEDEEEAPVAKEGDDGEEAPKPKRAKRKGPPMSVLFTSFIIQ